MSKIGDVKIDVAKGLRELSEHFAKPASHDKDGDTSHVTKDEFQKAKAELSPDAGAVIDTILQDDKAYYNLRHQTWESGWGYVNDEHVSTSDLRTAAAAPTTAARLQRQTELLKWREENRPLTSKVMKALAHIDADKKTDTASANFKHWLNAVQRHPEIPAEQLADTFIELAGASPKKADSLFREWLNDPPPTAGGLKSYTED
ncbi:MAG: hypothetical protein R3C68_13860 [Myxococcota bacterium]